jgi:uncharacterized protein (DUF983 family)
MTQSRKHNKPSQRESLCFKWGKRLKLTECPKCKEPQKLSTLLLINNKTNKKCHKCGCVLKDDSGKSALLLVSIIFPVFILEQFKGSLGDWYISNWIFYRHIFLRNKNSVGTEK